MIQLDFWWHGVVIPLLFVGLAIAALLWARYEARQFDKKWGKDPE